MDPLRIAARALFAYVLLLVLVRVSGKRTVTQGSPFDLAVALILGELVDSLLMAEVAVAQFAVAAGVLGFTHFVFERSRLRTLGHTGKLATETQRHREK